MPYKTIEYEDANPDHLTAGQALADDATEQEQHGWRPVLMQWVPADPSKRLRARLVVLYWQPTKVDR